MSLTLERQNQYRARYAQATPGWQPATVVYENLIRHHCHAGMRLLDVGCGRGGVLEQLQDIPLSSLGIDPDIASLQEHRLPQLPRVVALADALPLKSGSLDMLIAAWVLEHISAPETVFSEIGRLLKVGGVFIFLTPNRHSLVTNLNRLFKPLQNQLVPRLYGRAEADTFPVVYRANTPHAIRHLAQTYGMILEDYRIIADPTYLAFHEILYRLSVLLTRLLPAASGVHLVGVCRKV